MKIILPKKVIFSTLSSIWCIASALLILSTSAGATITMKIPFSNSMVLQRNLKVNVWGTAASGETVTVKFNGQQKTIITGTSKAWKIQLDAMVAGGPYTMTVSGTNTVTFTDVYVGEVWQCGGQSNMDLTLSSTDWGGAFDSEIASANLPKLRYMKTRNGNGTWNVISPSTAAGCSATGYFFGKELLQNVDCVVGLMVTAVGGTTIEQWFDPATATSFKGKTDASITPGDMYSQFVTPVISYGIRGTVWIQGEQNSSKGFGTTDYGNRFKAVITNWRKAWGQGDFPFYYGQITGINTTQAEPFPKSPPAEVREGQREALELPQTAMAVMLDISGGGWHYKNKQEAGRRLALLPKALVYGKNIEYCGPLFQSFSVAGNTATVKFSHTTGLKTNDAKVPAGFALAGSDGVWYAADKSAITANNIVISSTKVLKPVRISYGWNDRPRLNLYNSDNLQASPFLADVLITTSINDADNDRDENNLAKIFPNPAIGNELKIAPGEGESVTDIVIFDLSGEAILKKEFGAEGVKNELVMDISTLPKGTFILQIKSQRGIQNTKFIH